MITEYNWIAVCSKTNMVLYEVTDYVNLIAQTLVRLRAYYNFVASSTMLSLLVNAN